MNRSVLNKHTGGKTLGRAMHKHEIQGEGEQINLCKYSFNWEKKNTSYCMNTTALSCCCGMKVNIVHMNHIERSYCASMSPI